MDTEDVVVSSWTIFDLHRLIANLQELKPAQSKSDDEFICLPVGEKGCRTFHVSDDRPIVCLVVCTYSRIPARVDDALQLKVTKARRR